MSSDAQVVARRRSILIALCRDVKHRHGCGWF
jgi:hypothetical protein